MKKAPLTPEELSDKAKEAQKNICTAISAFIVRNRISKKALAETIGINQQNMSRILDHRRKTAMHTLLLVQAGLEQMTGVPLQCPRFTQPGSPAQTEP